MAAMKKLAEMTPQERAALTQEQLDRLLQAAIPRYPSGQAYLVTLDDLQRHESLFVNPLSAKGPQTPEEALYLAALMEAGFIPGMGWA